MNPLGVVILAAVVLLLVGATIAHWLRSRRDMSIDWDVGE